MSYPYLIEYSHILYEPIFKSERPAIILFSNSHNQKIQLIQVEKNAKVFNNF